MLRWSRIRKVAESPMPLLAKELIEQSARKRTYVIRIVYAVLLFVLFGLAARDLFRESGYRAIQMMGTGRSFLSHLVNLQFYGIFLFLPGMMSGVITYEKERESLALLMLTDLGPWEILFQKYIGRLVPMFTFILLGLPLVGSFYALGGIETSEIVTATWLLCLSALQVGAFSLMFSAWCRTTTAALVTSYLFTAAFCIGPMALPRLYFSEYLSSFLAAFNPACVYAKTTSGGISVTLWSLPALGSVIIFLAMGKRFLRTRAFVPPKRRLLALFRRQDAFLKQFNAVTGGIVLIPDRSGLPEEDPVAWREVTKTPLGKINYLLRLMLLVEIPLFLAAIGLVMTEYSGMGHERLTMVIYILWGVATLAIVARAADVVASERTRQTLDVLLTTPIPGADIVRQKMSGVWRMILVLLIPFLTMFGVEGFWSRNFLGGEAEEWGALYIPFSTATMLVYLAMFAWFANWVGMTCRSRTRAVSTALVLVALWCVVPLLAMRMLDGFGIISLDGPFRWSWFTLLSPATVIPMLEGARPGNAFGADFPMWGIFLANLAWHSFLLYIFRLLCILRADRYLGRAVPGPVPSAPPASVQGKAA